MISACSIDDVDCIARCGNPGANVDSSMTHQALAYISGIAIFRSTCTNVCVARSILSVLDWRIYLWYASHSGELLIFTTVSAAKYELTTAAS